MIYHHSFGNHRLMKKILSVCVVLALICSISIPTFAEDTANSTESNSAQQPTLGITEGSLADESQNDTEAEESQVLDAQEDENSDVEAYAGGNYGGNNNDLNYSGQAAIYYLADPTGDPWINDTGAWAPSQDTSNTLAQINTYGATWETGYVGDDKYPNKNIKKEVAKYITSWPDSSKGATWTVKKGDPNTNSYFEFILNSIWDSYKSFVEAELKVPLSKENITEITLTPRKISRDNGGQYPYHVDCALSIKSNQVFTAKFWVKNPRESEYTQVDARNYKTGSAVEKTGNETIESEKTVDGVTYVLDGWYAEDAGGGAYGNKIENTSWPYSPNPTELDDGTVNFYAHYSPMYTSVKISKNVTGSMGDLNKSFHFTITVKNGEKDLAFKVDEDEKDYTGTALIDLKNGESKTLVNVPVNATVTVTEDNYGTGQGGYTTSYEVDGAGKVAGLSATIDTITAAENGHQIVFTNNKDVTPDTGLYLTSWPYLMMLALAAGGALVFFMRRRRRS